MTNRFSKLSPDPESELYARLDPEALAVALETFRAYHASWEGSVAIAICAYEDAIRANRESRLKAKFFDARAALPPPPVTKETEE